jgi:hypothetical protein
MAKVSGSSRRSPKYCAIYQDSPSDSSAERQHHHIASAASGAPQYFRNQGGARIVIGTHRQAFLSDYFAQTMTFEEM